MGEAATPPRPPEAACHRRLVLGTSLAMLLAVAPSGAMGQDHGARNRFPSQRGFIDPQLKQEPGGPLLMLWAHPTTEGYDLHLASREEGAMFAEPVRVNDAPGSVRIGPDEMRPSIASAAGGTVAVAWTDARGSVMAALGRDHGTRFDAPFPLDQEKATIAPSYVVVDLDPQGRLHAAWIDFRHAERGQTGPAHLYYALVERDRVFEQNVTAAFTSSVCANSRPAIRVQRRGQVELYFRSMSDDGGRDVFQLVREASGAVDEPVRLGRPQATGSCQPAGPVHRDGVTVWLDRSEDRGRLLANRSPGTATSVVATEGDGWSITASPRFVESDVEGLIAVYAPGSPRGRIYRLEGGSWTAAMEDVPHWCTGVAWVEGQILMVGDVQTELRVEAKVVDP